LEAALAQRFGVKVRLTTKVDKEILGGLIVRVGDKLVDGSLVARLQSASAKLKSTKVA
jgi:F-type H+-transporting ATPase subunit delta